MHIRCQSCNEVTFNLDQSFCAKCGAQLGSISPVRGASLPETGGDKERKIDAQWDAAIPKGWGTFGDKRMHSGERKMLYDILDNQENIVALVGGMYRAEQDTNRLHKHSGVAVATSKRVIFLDKGLFGSTEVSEMPYRSIEAITHSTGMFYGGIQITGRGRAGFRIENVQPKKSAKAFADQVRYSLEAVHRQQTPQPPPQPDPSDSSNAPVHVADEIEKLARLLKDGILTQDEFDGKKKQLLGL